MKDEFSQMMTPFDQAVTSQPLQMLKLLLPFLPPQTQRIMAIYIKFSEFQNALSSFYGLSSQNDPMEEFKKIIPDSVWDSYETMAGMMSMMDLFNDMEKEGETDEQLDE